MGRLKINRNVMLLAGAIALGVVAAMLSVNYVRKRVDEQTAAAKVEVRKTTVVVPKRDLEQGAVVTADDLSTRDVPVDYVPADAVTPENYLGVVDRMLRAPVREGAPISSSQLVPLHRQFSHVIAAGKVGYTMEVDEVNSVSGMIAPGDAVDVLVTFNRDDAGGGRGEGERVMPLLENVVVLATGRQVGEGVEGEVNGSFSSITLELEPTQAERLAVGRKVGQVQILLRSNGDAARFGLTGLTEKRLTGNMQRGSVAARDVKYILGNR